jgi:hypothetical protein
MYNWNIVESDVKYPNPNLLFQPVLVIFFNYYSTPSLVRDSSAVRYGFLFDLLEPWDVRALSIRKTADLPL